MWGHFVVRFAVLGALSASVSAQVSMPSTLPEGGSTTGFATTGIGGGASSALPSSATPQYGGSSQALPSVVPGVDLSNIPLLPAQSGAGLPGVPATTASVGSSGSSAQAQQNATGRQPRIQSVPSAFEKFVVAATGRVVKPFGSSLFGARSFAPQSQTAVTGDYVLAPGDEVLVYAWGGINLNYRAVVDKAGQINIPRVGAFTVAGIRSADLESTLKSHIGRYFTNFQLSASVSQVRGLQVYVVGQAVAPGTYTVPGTSTLVSAVFEVAEPGPNGTMRRIQLKRGNQLVTEIDLYEFLLYGDSGRDVRLISGDVIVIPPAGPRVAVVGSVDTPAIYEVKDAQRSLDDVLRMAGAFRALADTSRVQLERIQPHDVNAPRTVLQVPLASMGKTTLLSDGDLITVLEGRPAFANAVTLRGSVAYPLRHAFVPGMKVRDLIPDKAALVTFDYYRRTNALVQRLDDEGRIRERTLETFMQDERRTGYRMPDSDSLPSHKKNDDPRTGQFAGSNALLLKDALTSGQSQRPSTEVRNRLDEINWDYAVVERMDVDNIKPTLLPFNLGKALSEPDGTDNLALKPGDVVTVFSVRDLPVPKSKRSAFVRVSGEVKAPGVYAIAPGETLRDAVRKAGGFTADAFVFGSELKRESTRVDQEMRYAETLNQIEKDLSRSATVTTAGALSAEDAAARQAQIESQRRFLERLRTIKPSGRVVLSLADEARQLSDLPNLPMEDGDVFDVPARPATVNVFGSVFGEGAYLYRSGNTIGDMIAQAGGSVRTADPGSTFVIRPNGTVISARQGGFNWLGGIGNRQALPGDTIVVPEDYERVPNLRFFKDIATVFGQFGIGVAAIRAINR